MVSGPNYNIISPSRQSPSYYVLQKLPRNGKGQLGRNGDLVRSARTAGMWTGFELLKISIARTQNI